MLKLVDVKPLRSYFPWGHRLVRIRMVSMDASGLWSVHSNILSILPSGDDKVSSASVWIQDILFRWGRRNTVFVMSNSCSAQVLSSSSPLLLCFPTPFFPRTPSQVMWSVPIIRNSVRYCFCFSSSLSTFRLQLL